MNITVFGAGLVGKAIAKDLALEPTFNLTVVDINPEALNALKNQININILQANLQEIDNFETILTNCHLAICAVPGFMGFETLKKIISSGVNVVDISFFSEDPLQLDELAQSKGVTAVVDCGVAPGLSNIIAGYVNTLLDQIESYACYVGGLPQIRHWPYEYKAVFSPIDVIEEYIRPARLVEYGREVVKPALSDLEHLSFPQVGTLEAFNTDGLRSLTKSMDIPFMKEKTLRYPGHANLMRVFRESGFFDANPVSINGVSIRPIDLTAKLLFERWKLNEGEHDLTVMQVIIEGQKGDKKYRYTYDLLDKYDCETQTHSMARTTGYTCTILARQVLNGLLAKPGICLPEYAGQVPGCFENLLTAYKKRNIHLTETIVEL